VLTLTKMRAVDEPHSQPPDPGFETSLDLLRRAQAGDADALNTLIARYLPRMQRWASGRLPADARGMGDTQDLVQETVTRAFKNIEGFEIRGEGALQAYLRQALLNQIRQEIRKASSRLPPGEADAAEAVAAVESQGPSPLEEAIGAEALERYEQALARLRPEDREAIIARIELGLSHQQVAEALGKPSANAARMAVERALSRLLKEMSESGNAPP
jgi:RNA polymerase sigma factor (sigma-70 family)